MSESSAETVCLASIMIDIAGDFATRQELKLRKQIEERIKSLQIGPCVGSGSGMGMMDIEFLVDDQEIAKAAVERAMSESFPTVKYSLDFTITQGKKEDFIEESGGCAKSGAAAMFLMALGLWHVAQWIL